MVAQWIVDGRAPVDVTHYSVERALPHETTRRFRGERVVEQLGRPVRRRRRGRPSSGRAAAASGARCSTTGSPRPVRGSASRRLGVPAVVRRARTPDARPTERDLGPRAVVRRASREEHRAVREARRRDGHVADVEVPASQGPDAGDRPEPALRQRRRRRRRPGRLHPVVRRRRRDPRRPDRHPAGRRPVPRRRQRRHPPPGASDAASSAEPRRGRDHHRRHRGHDAAVGAGPALAGAAAVAVARRLVRRGLPVPHRPRDRGRLRPASSRCGSPTSASSATSCTSRRPGASRVGGPRRGRRRRTACARSGCSRWGRCGWRRATATTASTSRTPTTRSTPGSASPSPGTSRAGSSGATRCCAPRTTGPPRDGRRCCSTIPSRCCTAASRCCSDGAVGRLRPGGRLRPHAAAPRSGSPWSSTRTASPPAWLARAAVRGRRRRHPLPGNASLRPFYDPDRIAHPRLTVSRRGEGPFTAFVGLRP